MNEWIKEHWQSLTFWISTSGVVAIWTWFSAHNGKIRSACVWIRNQFRLNSELAKASAANSELAKKNELLSSQLSDASAKIYEQDDLLKPPPLNDREINILRLLAIRGTPIECHHLMSMFKSERTLFDHCMHRLISIFYLVRLREFADTRPNVYELTESGKEYAVSKSLC